MALRIQDDASAKTTKKVDLFHPDMPQIPGLEGIPPVHPYPAKNGPVKAIAMSAAGVLLAIGVATVWWSYGKNHAPSQQPPSDTDIAQPAAAAPEPPPPLPGASVISTASSFDEHTQVGTAEELSAAWASKKFVFVKPFTREQVNAIAVRLPNGDLWAFALQEPNGRCELQYTTDLHSIAADYKYRASHPMVVNPCNGTVYDPLKVGSLGGDVLVRGDIVRGSGSRPPLSINVEKSGKFIVADRME